MRILLMLFILSSCNVFPGKTHISGDFANNGYKEQPKKDSAPIVENTGTIVPIQDIILNYEGEQLLDTDVEFELLVKNQSQENIYYIEISYDDLDYNADEVYNNCQEIYLYPGETCSVILRTYVQRDILDKSIINVNYYKNDKQSDPEEKTLSIDLKDSTEI